MRYIFRNKVEENFTVLRNSCIRDKELTWEARGLLHYLLSMPEDWEVSKQDIISKSPSASDYAVGRILKELERAGYIFRNKYRNYKGQWVWVTLVYDVPMEENMNRQEKKALEDECEAILGPEILERTKSIKEKATVTKPTPEKLKLAAAGIGENDPLEGYPVHCRLLLAEFVSVSQIPPTKRKKSDWIDTANEWREMGVKPKEVKKMYDHAVENGLDISRPGSITFAYYPMKKKKTSVDNKGIRTAE